MATIKIPISTTALDVAFNLSGSLAGFPAVLAQLPVGERIGFATLPGKGDDVSDIGQTWTPELSGLTLDFNVPIYNQKAVDKAPFSTDLYLIGAAAEYGMAVIKQVQLIDE